MIPLPRLLCLSSFAALCAAPVLDAQTNLVTNGTFNNVVLTSTGKSQTNLYGQFGTDSGTTPAKNSQITVVGWNTGGYNFVYLPGTLDARWHQLDRAGGDGRLDRRLHVGDE